MGDPRRDPPVSFRWMTWFAFLGPLGFRPIPQRLLSKNQVLASLNAAYEQDAADTPAMIPRGSYV